MDNAVRTTLGDISRFLSSQEIPFAVIGGIAVIVRGEPRFTADVDVVAGIELDRALELIEATERSPFRTLFPDADEVVRTSFILPLQHVDTEITVDLAIGLSGFERNMIARAESVDFEEFAIPVATAEDLILMKLLAARPRDTDDASRIVARQADSLDWDYLLETGAELEEALSLDIVSPLQRLRPGDTDGTTRSSE